MVDFTGVLPEASGKDNPHFRGPQPSLIECALLLSVYFDCLLWIGIILNPLCTSGFRGSIPD